MTQSISSKSMVCMSATMLQCEPDSTPTLLTAQRKGWFVLCSLLLLMAIYILTSSSGRAQNNPPAPVVIHSAVTPLETATNIKSQPLALLSKFPDAGPSMAQYVATIFTREPSLVDAILSVIRDASPQQASAIGAGLIRGLRAIHVTRAALSSGLVDKIMRSDNRWLKTTFHAIGQRDPGMTTFVVTEPIAPAPRGTMVVGATMPLDKSRIGPVQTSGSSSQTLRAGNKRCSFLSESSDFQICRGTIVALVTADATRSGAVSTSPTQ